MTPEEQFLKITNALRHAAAIQAQHAETMAHHGDAIRDLIAASRILLDTARLHSAQIATLDTARERDREEFSANFNALVRAQQETEQKLQRWIDRQNHA